MAAIGAQQELVPVGTAAGTLRKSVHVRTGDPGAFMARVADCMRWAGPAPVPAILGYRNVVQVTGSADSPIEGGSELVGGPAVGSESLVLPAVVKIPSVEITFPVRQPLFNFQAG